MKTSIKEAKRHLQKVRELAKHTPSSFRGMSLQQAIARMRKIREQLWEEKLAARS